MVSPPSPDLIAQKARQDRGAQAYIPKRVATTQGVGRMRRTERRNARIRKDLGSFASRSEGIGGSPFHASLTFLSPETMSAGLFYNLNDRWTFGVVGQRLVQERSVTVEGQLVDTNDLSSFIDGFRIDEKVTSISAGPYAQFRILAEDANWPSLSVAAYALEFGSVTSASTTFDRPSLIAGMGEDSASSGDSADKYRSIYLSAAKRISLGSTGSFLRSLRLYGGAGYGMRTGKRYTTAQTGAGDPRVHVVRKDITRHSFVGWAGTSLELPAKFSAFAEVFTGDECEAGYSAGVRWVSPIGITFTFGITNCFAAIPQRSLNLEFLPGGVGGQPSVVSGGSSADAGALGSLGSLDDD